MTEEFYYSRKPTSTAPASVLIGPFGSEFLARTHLLDAVKSSEDDLPGAAPWGEYQLFKSVATVLPVVTRNVKLKTL